MPADSTLSTILGEVNGNVDICGLRVRFPQFVLDDGSGLQSPEVP